MKFADALVISIEELDSAILNALKGNPSMSINELVDVTQTDFYKVEESIARLTKNGFLDDTIGGFKPTQKALDKPTEPIVSREIYTVYKYEVNEDKPYAAKSRTFCTKLMSLGNEYTFEEIDTISLSGVGKNVGGTNIWDYRGGYYNNPSTGQIDPDCRHLWMAETRVRNKEKK